MAFPVHPDSLTPYLMLQENLPGEIAKLYTILQMDPVILEIGCGSGDVAREIAKKNPRIGVIATDQYDWTIPVQQGSYYQKTAWGWKERRLASQQNALDNLVLLRADIGMLRHLPEGCIDTILLVNPEPKVGRALLESLADPPTYRKIKPGEKQIIILPFSREMGVTCCGGNEFDHGEDWSRGLGFMMASGFTFRKAEPSQWQVDLVKRSLYSCNSTQKDVYVFGDRPPCEDRPRPSTGRGLDLKGVLRSARHLLKFRI